MYRNVKVEMARKNINIMDLADKTGIRYQTLTLKLNGSSQLLFSEARKIKAALETEVPLEDLFAEEVP